MTQSLREASATIRTSVAGHEVDISTLDRLDPSTLEHLSVSDISGLSRRLSLSDSSESDPDSSLSLSRGALNLSATLLLFTTTKLPRWWGTLHRRSPSLFHEDCKLARALMRDSPSGIEMRLMNSAIDNWFVKPVHPVSYFLSSLRDFLSRRAREAIEQSRTIFLTANIDEENVRAFRGLSELIAKTIISVFVEIYGARVSLKVEQFFLGEYLLARVKTVVLTTLFRLFVKGFLYPFARNEWGVRRSWESRMRTPSSPSSPQRGGGAGGSGSPQRHLRSVTDVPGVDVSVNTGTGAGGVGQRTASSSSLRRIRRNRDRNRNRDSFLRRTRSVGETAFHQALVKDRPTDETIMGRRMDGKEVYGEAMTGRGPLRAFLWLARMPFEDKRLKMIFVLPKATRKAKGASSRSKTSIRSKSQDPEAARLARKRRRRRRRKRKQKRLQNYFLLNPYPPIPYQEAIDEFSKICQTGIPEDQLKHLRQSVEMIFDHLPRGVEVVSDVDLSLLMLYVVVHSDVYKPGCWLKYAEVMGMELLRSDQELADALKLFSSVVEWASSQTSIFLAMSMEED